MIEVFKENRMFRRAILTTGLLSLLLAARCATNAPAPPAPASPQAERPQPPVTAETLARIEADLVRIPAGTLPADFRTEHAVRSLVMDPPVKIASFLFGKHEVTQEEWVAVMGDNPSQIKGDPRLPVTDVSWLDSQRFIARLNEARGASLYRLPTAEEWEYACRCGAKGHVAIQAKESTLNEYAWWGRNSGGSAHPAGMLKSNAFGLQDMLGNVAEWCQTKSDLALNKTLRITAGANFADENLVGQDCHPGGAMGEDGKDRFTGFRLARTIPPPAKTKKRKAK
jgi:formylglycine-generating enzyme required for sulfatase activity